MAIIRSLDCFSLFSASGSQFPISAFQHFLAVGRRCGDPWFLPVPVLPSAICLLQ
jgi:hypothetical protein